MESAWTIWLIAAAVFVIIELLTNTFAAFCLVGGCLLAMIAALLGLGLIAQLSAAVIGIVLSFIALKPLIIKHIKHRPHEEALSNMDALIGRRTKVTEASTETRPGRAHIDGDNWQITSVDGTNINISDEVEVVGYDSIVLKVKKVS